jgi:hypothetical protein
MKALDLYFCSFSNFSKPFRNNEHLYKQAQTFWSQLDNAAWVAFGLAVVIGAGMAVFYYTAYNNMSGRHYKPKFWWIFMALALVATSVVTLVVELMLASPKLDGAFWVEFKIALINMAYALIPFLLTSLAWCNFHFPTNAYRYLKFFKS